MKQNKQNILNLNTETEIRHIAEINTNGYNVYKPQFLIMEYICN